MWPWEHLAFGYVIYSAYSHFTNGRPPDHRPVVALAIATQFADILDKPLAWTLGVLPTGRSLGHSVFFAVPVVVLVAFVASRRDRPAVGLAVAIGYGSHLLGDVIYGFVREGSVEAAYLFWPLVRATPRDTTGLYSRTAGLLTEFLSFLGSPAGLTYLAMEFLFLTAVFVLWATDGWPGFRRLGERLS